MDDLSLVETVDRRGESIVITVADAAHRRLDARLYQSLGVLDRDVLAALVAVMYEPAAMGNFIVDLAWAEIFEKHHGSGARRYRREGVIAEQEDLRSDRVVAQ
jgi:hypothetical protein